MIKKDSTLFRVSFLYGILLTVLIAGYVVVPVTHAAIDETMPATIPTEILSDWKDQGGTAAEIKASLPEEYAAKCDGSFESACHWRRVYRMSQFPQMETILFTRHHNVGSIAVGFWVNVGSSDITDANFEAKGALCLQKFENYYSSYTEILKKNDACVKDPCISLDGKKVCFAMSGNGKGTGYRLYEMNIDDPGSIQQLTENPAGLTVADFEPCYLPNGDIMFSSTRCFGVIDCGWQATTNMFVMNGEGKYIRQLGYDQVHTFYPVLCGNGTVLYTRWEYNDRDISNVMGLFRMNPDGCHQTEVFGNQTTWPQTMIHGRPVPGSPELFFGVASGHHGAYSGEVFVCNVFKNTNGPENVTMISPKRKTETLNKNDAMAMGGVYRNSEYPYPLNKDWYLVSYRDVGQEPFGRISRENYKIYLKSVDGESRELLAWGDQSLHHPVLVAPWKEIWGEDPVQLAEYTNYNDSVGTITMQDVYFGAGMKGVDKSSGVAKSLRVVKMSYRVSGACNTGAGQVMGPKPSDVIFSAPNICPVSLWGASWDAKEVIGEAKIYEDGSAAFTVPARTPLYFQVLDSNGCSIAGMRSWSTLMPGETFACYGCHENKSEAPPPTGVAMAGTAKPLEKPLGIEGKPFDFGEFVQPILDKHCVSCHGANHRSGFDLRGDLVYNSSAKKSFTRSYSSLLKGIGSSRSNKAINIATIFSQPPQMPPNSFGSTKSGMIENVLTGHNDVNLTAKEIKILATWIDLEAPFAGSYNDYMSGSDSQRYQQLESAAQKWYDIEAENIKELALLQGTPVLPREQAMEVVVPVGKNFRVGYLPTEHALVLNGFHQGNLLLVDVRGKVISRKALTDLPKSGSVSVTLPASMSAGLYIARLEGAGGVEHVPFSVTR